MEGCASSLVSLIDVDVFLFKVEKRGSCIALSRHVEHVQTEKVFSMRVSPVCHQSVNSVHIAFEGGQVERSEFVCGGARVDPLFYGTV